MVRILPVAAHSRARRAAAHRLTALGARLPKIDKPAEMQPEIYVLSVLAFCH